MAFRFVVSRAHTDAIRATVHEVKACSATLQSVLQGPSAVSATPTPPRRTESSPAASAITNPPAVDVNSSPLLRPRPAVPVPKASNRPEQSYRAHGWSLYTCYMAAPTTTSLLAKRNGRQTSQWSMSLEKWTMNHKEYTNSPECPRSPHRLNRSNSKVFAIDPTSAPGLYFRPMHGQKLHIATVERLPLSAYRSLWQLLFFRGMERRLFSTEVVEVFFDCSWVCCCGRLGGYRCDQGCCWLMWRWYQGIGNLILMHYDARTCILAFLFQQSGARIRIRKTRFRKNAKPRRNFK